MGDITTWTKPKDVGTSSIQFPMLTSTNYTVWAMRMTVALRVHEVWDAIDPRTTDSKKNNFAIALLFQSIPENLIMQLGELNSAKVIWDAIKLRHLGADRVREARLQTLMADFDKLTMGETDSIDDFAGRLSSLASKSASLGQNVEETKLVKKFLKSLPRSKFIHIVASLEQVLDLNTTSFEDIVGRLKAYEERIGEESHSVDQGKLMFSNSESQRNRGEDGGQRGRGGGNRGRGKGKGRSSNHSGEGTNQNKSKEKQKKDRSKIICFKCEKPGHFASSCPEKIQRTQEANIVETQEADIALYMHEVVLLNEKNEVVLSHLTET